MKIQYLPAARVAALVRASRFQHAFCVVIRPGHKHLTPRRRALPFSPGEKAGMRAVTQYSRLRNSQLLRNLLISRFSKISPTADRAIAPAKPEPVKRRTVNPNSAIRNSRADRRSGIEAETTRNVPSCFAICFTSQPLVHQRCFGLYRFVSLSIPLSEWSINSAQPSTFFCPKDLRLSPRSSDQHTPTHCHTLFFFARPNRPSTSPLFLCIPNCSHYRLYANTTSLILPRPPVI